MKCGSCVLNSASLSTVVNELDRVLLPSAPKCSVCRRRAGPAG